MIERPEFRMDLVSRPIDDGGSVYVDVTDPDSGCTFRFYEVEYAVACAMDGKRDINGILSWTKEELGLDPSEEEVEVVVNTLEDLGYLVGYAATVIPGETGVPEEIADEAAVTVDLGRAGRSPIDAVTEKAPTQDIELGFAGGMAEERTVADVVPPTDIELGSAGGAQPTDEVVLEADEPPADVVPIATRQAPRPPSDDVSVDLSAHLDVGTEDVKEAVRQSRMMDAVVPADTAFDDEPADAAERVVARASNAAIADDFDDLDDLDEVVAPAISAPRPSVSVSVAPPLRPTVTRGAKVRRRESEATGAILMVVTLLIIVAAAFYFYWMFWREPGPISISQATPITQPEPQLTATSPQTLEHVQADWVV